MVQLSTLTMFILGSNEIWQNSKCLALIAHLTVWRGAAAFEPSNRRFFADLLIVLALWSSGYTLGGNVLVNRSTQCILYTGHFTGSIAYPWSSDIMGQYCPPAAAVAVAASEDVVLLKTSSHHQVFHDSVHNRKRTSATLFWKWSWAKSEGAWAPSLP